MKVLIITDAWHPQVNGVVRTYEYLIEELEKLGHSVKVISPSDFSRTIPMPGYPEIKLALFPGRRLKTIVESYKPDAVHISTEGPIGWAGRNYCVKHGQPFTTSYHTQFPDYVAKRFAKYLPFLFRPIHSIAKWVVRKFHSRSKVMMVATPSLEEQLKDWGFKTPMHRLVRGANLDLFYPGERTQFIDLPHPVALCVGRVAIEKNLEAFLDMDWDGSKVVVGDGPSKEELSKRYPNVHFAGKKFGDELAEYYRSADLFVFPSKTDTFGIVLVEALASGLPIAGFNVTGPKDIVTKDFLGALHEDDLGLAAKNALKSGTREQRAQYVKDFYTWEYAGKQFETALKVLQT